MELKAANTVSSPSFSSNPFIDNMQLVWQMTLWAMYMVEYQRSENRYRIQCGKRLLQLDSAILTVLVRVKGGYL